MFRIASQRILASTSRPIGVRCIATTPVRLIKIKHQDGSTNRPGGSSTTTSPKSTPAPATPSPSPAEKPSSPPVDTPSTKPASSPAGAPFEPIINKATEPAPRTVSSSSAVDEPSSTASEPIEEIDYSKLPSLNVDSELAQLAEPAKEKTEGEAGSSAGASGTTGAKRRTGAGRKDYVSSIEKQRRAMLRYSIGALVLGGLGVAYFGSGESVEKAGGTSVGGWERLKNNANDFLDYFNKPAFKTLLPDALPPPHQRPYTLLIDMEGMLVTSTWDRTNGWRTAKRPGVDYFLAYLSLFYEIVLFTHQPLYTAAPVAEKLDPFQAYLPYKLFRDSTRTVDGKVVKDLTYLNRDLSKVIMLDTNPEHAALQPENAIIIPPWEGKGGEQGLVELIPFLESIAYYNVKDVRPALQFYQGKDIAQEYAKIEAEQKAQATKEWERSHPNSVHGAGSGFVSSMFGGLSKEPGKSQRPNQPMTFIEQKRAESQRMYQEEQKYWRDHSEEFKKLIEDDKQRQLAEMKGSLWSWMGGAPPPKPKEGEAQPALAK